MTIDGLFKKFWEKIGGGVRGVGFFCIFVGYKLTNIPYLSGTGSPPVPSRDT